MPAVPKEAASVLLLRDAPGWGGVEVLMVRRHPDSDFAPSMHVFPGGAVEKGDYSREMADLCTGLGPEEAMCLIPDAPSPTRALGILVAAIRETFEETGILLACPAAGEPASCREVTAARFAAYRRELGEGRLCFREVLEKEGLRPVVERLVYFAHWITPDISPIRYDTRFFLAAAPSRQVALHDGVETTDHLWISPALALERNRRGDLAMLPPTMFNLMNLREFATVEEALASAVTREVPLLAPRVSLERGRMRLIIPGETYS